MFGEILEERDQLQQLIVRRLLEPALDGDPVVDLVGERLRRVVDDEGSREITAQNV